MKIDLFYVSLFIFSVFISSVSQIFLKKAALKKYASIKEEYLNPKLIFAYGLFFISSVLTMLAYKGIPLSMGPVLESAGFVFVAFLSHFFLKERISVKKTIGIALIVFGIFIFAFGGSVF